jgi:Ca2+-binding EF-hand superfamily protein
MEGNYEKIELAVMTEWEKIMDEADDNGDGEIDITEFKNLMNALVPLQTGTN